MEKSELLRQMGFSEKHIESLQDYSKNTVSISPTSFSDGTMHHISSDTNELTLIKGNEGDDREFKISL